MNFWRYTFTKKFVRTNLFAALATLVCHTLGMPPMVLITFLTWLIFFITSVVAQFFNFLRYKRFNK
jgi:hypothetical protein